MTTVTCWLCHFNQDLADYPHFHQEGWTFLRPTGILQPLGQEPYLCPGCSAMTAAEDRKLAERRIP